MFRTRSKREERHRGARTGYLQPGDDAAFVEMEEDPGKVEDGTRYV